MEFAYVAYTEENRVVKGRISAADNETAMNLLDYGGYNVISLKPTVTGFLRSVKLGASISRIKPKEIVMFSRQLALLLESGTDIVKSLELLQEQLTNQTLKKAIGQVATDIRGGSSLSDSMAKHPRVFSRVYCQAVSGGEHAGNLEIVLRQMADYIERVAVAEKKIKSAMTYPMVVMGVAFAVVAMLVMFVVPTFTSLFALFGADLPLPTRMLLATTGWLGRYGVYLLGTMVAMFIVINVSSRSPAGKRQVHAAILRLPVIGRILLLHELARCCRTISLLFKVGVPIPEIMSHAAQGSSNRIVSEALEGVREELIQGQGLSKPMSRRPVFLSMMVQMVSVGEQTGNLDNTLATVARSYEEEADERTQSAIELIQPAITIVIGVVVSFVAIAMFSAMYGVYGQIN
jgi:type IV pilus assembly protein PilC